MEGGLTVNRSSVSIVNYELDDRGSYSQGIFFILANLFRRTLGAHTASYQIGTGIKQPKREADHSSPSIAKDNNAWIYTSTPSCFFMGRCLVKCSIRLHVVVVSQAQGTNFLPSPYPLHPLLGFFMPGSPVYILV
jgi:hypothetical protein